MSDETRSSMRAASEGISSVNDAFWLFLHSCEKSAIAMSVIASMTMEMVNVKPRGEEERFFAAFFGFIHAPSLQTKFCINIINCTVNYQIYSADKISQNFVLASGAVRP